MMAEKSYVFLTDIHYGFERKQGKKIPLHNPRILDAVGLFLEDFKPDVIIYGGDTLDCGPISHHNRKRNFSIEGLRLIDDAEGLAQVMRQYRNADHEDWLNDLIEDYPGLSGTFELTKLLAAPWAEMIYQGEVYKLGKLHFLHGDNVRSSLYPARWAVDAYEKSVRFGHFHTFQVHTKISALDGDCRTGIAVPCLCTRAPGYAKGSPNRSINGFNYGFVEHSGNYYDITPVATNNKFVAEGVEYAG
jgi:hypothetical protein